LKKVDEAIKETYIVEIKNEMSQLGEKEFNVENSDNNLVNEIGHLIEKINLEGGDFNLKKFNAEFDEKMNNKSLSLKNKVEEIKTKNKDQFLTELLLKTNKIIEKKKNRHINSRGSRKCKKRIR